MKKREEIEEKFKWDLSQYAKSVEDCEVKCKKLKELLPNFKKYEGKLNTAETIFECLEKQGKIVVEISKLKVFSSCSKDTDSTNDVFVELNDKVDDLITVFNETTSFIDVEISALDNEFLSKLQHDPEHQNHSNYFKDIIRSKKHILSDKEELILSQLGTFTGGFHQNLSIYESADIKFKPAVDSQGKEHPLSYSTYGEYLESNDEKLRDSAYRNLNGAFANIENLIANNYASHIKMASTFAKIRKYNSVLDAELEGNELSLEFYNMLLKKVKENAPILHRYLKAKKMVLGLDTMKISDVAAAVGKVESKKIPFKNAFSMLLEAVKPLGQEYVKGLKSSISQKWIDIYDNQGKRSGKYSTGVFGCNPLVFLKFNDDIESTTTLAHELGHAMHTYFANKAQPCEKADYPIFLAEIASTVNETLLTMNLINNAKTSEEKIYYINAFLEVVRGTIYRQTQFAEFEKIVFEKYATDKAISKKFLQEEYERLTQEYYGNGVELLPETKLEYGRIPHFYRQFYVYKYATGLLSAVLIVKKFLNNEPNMQEKYIKFLSSGSSLSPLETLKIVGIDLEKEESFDEAFEFIGKIEKDFEHLVQNQKNQNISFDV